MKRALLCLALVLVNPWPSADAFPVPPLDVDPGGTWLFVNQMPQPQPNPTPPPATFIPPADFAAPPTSLTLSGKAKPGENLFLRNSGYFSFTGSPADLSNSMMGLFNGTSVLPEGGLPEVTLPTHWDSIPTDIPQDFSISPQGTILRVPPGATTISFGPDDSFFSDNTLVGPYQVTVASFADVVQGAIRIMTDGPKLEATFEPLMDLTLEQAAILGDFKSFNFQSVVTSVTAELTDEQGNNIHVPITDSNCEDVVFDFADACQQWKSLRSPQKIPSAPFIDPISGGFVYSGPRDDAPWYYDQPPGVPNQLSGVDFVKFVDTPGAPLNVTFEFATALVGIRGDGTGTPILLPGTLFG